MTRSQRCISTRPALWPLPQQTERGSQGTALPRFGRWHVFRWQRKLGAQGPPRLTHLCVQDHLPPQLATRALATLATAFLFHKKPSGASFYPGGRRAPGT